MLRAGTLRGLCSRGDTIDDWVIFCPSVFCTQYSTCPSRRPGSCNLHWPPKARPHWRQCAQCCTEPQTAAVVPPTTTPTLACFTSWPAPATTATTDHDNDRHRGTDDSGGPRLTATPLTTCGGTESHGEISRHVASQARRQLEGSAIKSAADEGDMGAADQEALPPTHRSCRQHTVPLARHPRLCV